MKPNKVHKRDKKRSLCGVDRGLNRWKKVPTSRESRDVTCKHCLRIMGKN